MVYRDPSPINPKYPEYNKNDVDPRVANYTKQIREKIFGIDVREALARGVDIASIVAEEAKITSEEAKAITQSLLDGTFDDAELATEIERKLNELEEEYAPTLTEIGRKIETTKEKLDAKNWELNSRARRKQGLVVFISDDGHRGDWEVLKPIFENEGVPFCSAIVTDWMLDTSHPNHSSRMTWEQLEYLQNEMGCEIMSHSKTHGRPTQIPDMNTQGVREEYEVSKQELESRGFEVQSYRVPSGLYGVRERVIAKEYYRAMIVSDYGIDGLNRTPLEQYELKSIWLDNESFGGAKPFGYYQEHIDKAANENALLIISTHGYALDGVETLFEQVVEYANANSNVVTLKEALNRMGNIIDVGDFSKTSTGSREGGKHFVVGADGTVDGGLNVAGLNEYSSDSKWQEFPLGITLCPISSVNSEGFPVSAGVLINYKTRVPQFGFNHQEFRSYRDNRVYYRYVNEQGDFSNWELDNRTGNYNDNITAKSPISSFRLGTTYTRMKSDHPYIEEMPEGAPGLLITHRMEINEPWSFHFQEYHLNFSTSLAIYKRRCLGVDTWSDWVKVSP